MSKTNKLKSKCNWREVSGDFLNVLHFAQTQRTAARLLMWPPQAWGRHCFDIRNQSFPLVLDPVHHDVIATRQQGDELRVMDICIGTFPFPRQPLFTLKVLHIIHQYCPPGQSPAHGRHTCGGTFSLHVSALQPIRVIRCSALSPFRQRQAHKLRAGWVLQEGSWSEKKTQFNTAFNLFP